MTRRRVLCILLAFVWVIAFVVALSLDRSVAECVAKNVAAAHPPFINRLGWLARTLKLPGYFPVTLLIAAILWIFNRQARCAAVALVISGPLVGISYTFLKWFVGRHRPVIAIAPFTFHPFARGLTGLVHAESGLSFPSGHTALAFATATCLALVRPRWLAVFFLLAAAVGVERVLENAHYLSDVVAGAGIGILCGWAAMRLSASFINRHNDATS